VTITNTADATKAKFITALASGTVPDLFKMNAPDVIELAEQGALAPLDDLIKRDKWDLKQYFDFVVQHTGYKGKVYAITHHPDIRLFFWSKKLYRDAGLDEAKAPQSWADVEAHAQRLIKREGSGVSRYGFVPTWTSGSWLLQYWQANGAKVLSDDGKKVAFNATQAVDATAWALKLMDTVDGGNDAVKAFDTATNAGGAYRAFARERIGMMFYGNWLLFPVGEENPTLTFGTQTLPGGTGAAGKQFVFGGGTMVGVPKDSKKLAPAWEYLKFLGSKDGGYLTQKRTSDVSGHREAANLPEIVNQNLGRKDILPLFEKANALSYVNSPAGPALEKVLSDTQGKLLNHTLAPKDAVAEAAQLAQQALDEYWSRR
jgi:ABC-type glycerol-3-phosphate transport system substrate-binding protein